MPDDIFNTNASQPTAISPELGRYLVYLVKGNLAFTRLLTSVFDQVKSAIPVVVSADELCAKVAHRRPDLVVVLEDGQFYQKLKSLPGLSAVPFLLVVISHLDTDRLPELAVGDHSWVLRNDPAELNALVQSLVGESAHKRILCVDDSRTILKQYQKVFAGAPYTLFTAENGQTGLDLMLSVRPDLIITDIEMPVMDGLEFCRQIRSLTDMADLPLIIVSSRVDYDTIARGFEAGADEYLTKPFSPDELLNKVESYLIPPPARRQEQLLVVSRQQMVIHQLKLSLEKQGFVIETVRTPVEAMVSIKADPPDMVIADEDLADMSGFQLCAEIRSHGHIRHLPFVVMTSRNSVGARKMGQKVGVSGYLPKPFTREGAVALVERLLAEKRSLQALEWDMVLSTIMALARALDERDAYTRYHSDNVSRYAVAIGRKAAMDVVQLENLRLAGLLHDIGKIGIPDAVLHKPGKLTDAEFEKIKEHSTRGAEILRPIPLLAPIIPGILHHHERLDGAGYPEGLKGDEIPVMAQILAVADTYDALTTDRPYRKGLNREGAVAIMLDASGKQLSLKFVQLLIEWLGESTEP